MKKITILLAALCLAIPSLAGAADPTGPKILFVTGEREYFTEKSLTGFYQNDLKPLAYRAAFIRAKSNEGPERNDFPGLVSALKSADLLFVSVRRRAPKKAQLDALRQYLDSGKPLIGIRTTSHAFSLGGKPVPDGCAVWEDFDPVVLGGNYHGHFNDDPFEIAIGPARNHPILAGVNLAKSARLYRSGPLKPTTTTLLVSVAKKGQAAEPLAWTHSYGSNKTKVFYTSLGIAEDFENPAFRKLLVNAVAWATRPGH